MYPFQIFTFFCLVAWQNKPELKLIKDISKCKFIFNIWFGIWELLLLCLLLLCSVAKQKFRFNMADSNQLSGSNWTTFLNFFPLLFSSLKHYQIFKIEFVFPFSTLPQFLALACQIDQRIYLVAWDFTISFSQTGTIGIWQQKFVSFSWDVQPKPENVRRML